MLGYNIILLAITVVRLCGVQASPVTNTTTTGTTAVISQFTPPDYDWEGLRALLPPKAEWKGLYINKTENANSTVLALIDPEFMRLELSGEHELFILGWLAGLSWATIGGWVLGAAGTVSAIQGCVTDDGSAWGNYNCIVGLAGTLWGIGTGVKTAAALWYGRPENGWSEADTELVDIALLWTRSQDEYQELHERLVHSVLKRAFGDAEHIGYVSDGHRLSRRDDEHLHRRAPIFRVVHPRHGAMDFASREHVNGTRLTVTYANGVEKLGKRQSYQHEHLSSYILEGRFDGPASRDDPANPTFDAGSSFDRLEDAIKCHTPSQQWGAGDVLNTQLFDGSNQATFGYASMALFENSDQADLELQGYAPITPQPVDKSCSPGRR
ncbi:hypothetical protein C8F01DRAFT_1020911 [Mycena amicta]|nr:hypothetical protein C8F01DRAFT_1020911 [Mycena amicta]